MHSMRLTRRQLIEKLVQQATRNGFELHMWWPSALGLEWPGREEAYLLLSKERRHFPLVYSHPFAKAFWKHGARQPVAVAGTSYSYKMPNGEMKTVTRKPYTTRTLRANAWQWHLREMALYEEPLKYLRRFLLAEPPPPKPSRPHFLL